MSVKLAVVGATGLVGTKILEILAERNFQVESLILTASERSVGKKIAFMGTEYAVVSMEDAVNAKPDIAIFSAGGDTSLEWAPKFAEMGTIVVDNSSAWRMNPKNKLIVPEINANTLRIDDRIIANPNCSTIQMVLALAPLHKAYKIKRVVVSTYQSVTGTGKAAVDQLYGERNNTEHSKVYPHTLDLNVLPHVDVFQENGYTKEEMKMVNETKKILGDDSIQLSATCVRLPVTGGHSEAVNVQFENPFELAEVKKILSETDGIVLQDDPANNEYPMPLNAHDKDEVFVGRLRVDESQPNTLDMWIVSDNLRKGAATNAIQIAEYICEHNLVY